MSAWTISSVSSAGRLTIPQKLRARLSLRQGSKVLWQEVADGVVIMTTRSLSRPQVAEYLLNSLVADIGPDAEKLGIRDEGDLDRIVEIIRERTFAERYGTSASA